MTIGSVFSPNSGTCQHLAGSSLEPQATQVHKALGQDASTEGVSLLEQEGQPCTPGVWLLSWASPAKMAQLGPWLEAQTPRVTVSQDGRGQGLRRACQRSLERGFSNHQCTFSFLHLFYIVHLGRKAFLTASKPRAIRETRAAVGGRDGLKKPTLKAHTETGSHLGSPEKAEPSPTCASELKASGTVMCCATLASHLAFLGHF